jgi:DHA1 family bicyclomycin/chloramphenicol resistance-like MFS transporter
MQHIENSNKTAATRFLVPMILFIVPLTGMGIDLYAPSLPWIVSSLHTTASLVKLTIALYLFGYAIGPIFAGTFSDIKGRIPMLRIGASLYIISCLLIIFIPNIHVMLIMRFVQGLAAGFFGVFYRAISTDSFTPAQMKKLGASMALTWAIGPIIAPFIGGYLQHYFGWQSNFVFYTVYGILILILSFIIPETNRNPVKWHMKTITGHYKAILSNPIFWGCVICMGIAYGFIVNFNVIGPFLIQNILHYNAVQFGYIALGMGCAFFIGSTTNRILVHHLPTSKLIPLGLIGTLLGSILLLLLGLLFPVKLSLFIIPVFITLLMSSFIFPNAMSTAMSLFPKMAGAASAMTVLVFSAITAIASVIASFLLSTTQIPMGIAFIGLALICIIGYYTLMHAKLKQ